MIDKVSAALARGVKRSKTATEALQFIVGFMICGEEDSHFRLLNSEFGGGIGSARCRC